MGLAASQARFLGITARKNSCELRSMQIAQEKLSVTNQLSQLAENYQYSLDATRLVWDSEYITDGTIYDVSYALLMTPSLLNGYSPQLLTNIKNQVVLDSQYANAIKNVLIYKTFNDDGSPKNFSFDQMRTGGGDRTKANFIEFLKALNAGGILGQVYLDSMLTALNGSDRYYRPDNGLGGRIQEKFATDAMNLSTLTRYINSLTDINSKYMNELRDDADPNVYEKAIKLGNILSFSGVYDTSSGTEVFKPYEYWSKADKFGNPITTDADGDGKPDNKVTGTFGETIAKDRTKGFGQKIDINKPNFNFADLLTQEVYISSKDATVMGDTLCKFVDHLYQIMNEFFAIDPVSVDQDYLTYAMTQICQLNGLQWDSAAQKATVKDLNAAALSTSDPASKHTGLIKNGDTYQTSLSNLTKGLLTYFEKAVEGFNAGYSVNSIDKKKVDDSFYITKDPEYMYLINNPEINTVDDETQNLLDFYSQMFNQICANGWTENSLVNDKENLKNMLKNGTLFSTTLADDGNFYQGTYTSNNYIAEVADENAIARAEADFKAKQLQLSAKEEELNIDMQLVDAELAALTTEYDTVKNMISKAVEKGFSTLGG